MSDFSCSPADASSSAGSLGRAKHENYLLIKDVYALIAFLDRRQREVNEAIDQATTEQEKYGLSQYFYGLGEALDAARLLANYDPSKLQTSFGFDVAPAPLFEMK